MLVSKHLVMAQGNAGQQIFLMDCNAGQQTFSEGLILCQCWLVNKYWLANFVSVASNEADTIINSVSVTACYRSTVSQQTFIVIWILGQYWPANILCQLDIEPMLASKWLVSAWSWANAGQQKFSVGSILIYMNKIKLSTKISWWEQLSVVAISEICEHNTSVGYLNAVWYIKCNECSQQNLK